jgi:hypothetical protein
VPPSHRTPEGAGVNFSFLDTALKPAETEIYSDPPVAPQS